MARTGVLLVITAGVALASYGSLFSPADTLRDLAEITRISVAPDRDYRDSATIPTFAPSTPALRVEASAAEALPLPKPGTWTTVVTSGQSIVSPLRSSRSADPETRSQLTRDLQHELQGIGCYGGEITGSWNLATRRAMAAFLDRANAVLPYDQPDYVLLSLVQSHRDISCAAECPSGQVMQDSGRCVPQAVVAQAAKKQKRLEARQHVAARLADEREHARVAASEPEVLPWQQKAAAAVPLDIALAPRPDPLPGRMSIGGPLPVDAAPLPPVVVAPSRGTASSDEPSGVEAPAKLAALQYEPDADDLSDDASAPAADVAPLSLDAEASPHKAKKSRHSDSERGRRRNSYAYSGKRRHGDPRPGTARFNLMQSLGGIY
ncbi:hypothetical protein [Hyphomicrobium sp.]|jgi:hypothetical protein|uniref:hypothetical protein n=1 Tax=Hyphomicrobium sp. TaxID=82 RepID=UPI00356A5716